MGAQENKLPKLQILQNEILHMTILPVFSQFLWNLTFISSGSNQKLSLAVITDKQFYYMAKSVFALRLVDLRSVRLDIRTQNPKSKCSFRSSKSLYLEKKKV